MVRFHGKGVCGGVAIGRVRFFTERREGVKRETVADRAAEYVRFTAAHEQALSQLDELIYLALREVGRKEATVFEIHRMMLEDEGYLDSVRSVIMEQGVNAEYAVWVTRETFSRMLAEIDEPCMCERAADVRDISDRVLDCLEGKPAARTIEGEPAVMAARDLTPGETIQLDKRKVLGLVTCDGAGNSHTAVLARSMGIPAVVGVGDGFDGTLEGKDVVVDGFGGMVYVEPDADTLTTMQKKCDAESSPRTALKKSGNRSV